MMCDKVIVVECASIAQLYLSKIYCVSWREKRKKYLSNNGTTKLLAKISSSALRLPTYVIDSRQHHRFAGLSAVKTTSKLTTLT